jgi:hypothetical protein
MKKIIHELKKHIPFTALATLIAIFTTIFIIYWIKTDISQEFFHVLHPFHILASAIVTSGIFYKYKKSFIQALFIGVLGAIIIGSISDIIFPYLGGLAFNLNIEFHLPLIEMTTLILFIAVIGSILGISLKITKFPHFIHVFLSVFASLFYLLAFSQAFKIIYFIGAFFVVFIAVIIPCCLSDIIFPFLFLRKK